MKHARLHLWVGLLMVCSLACAAVGQLLPQGGSDAPDFLAQPESPAVVSLQWPAVGGAEEYLLEGRYGRGEFFEVARLSADVSAYTHFVVPGSAQIGYRLSAVTGGVNKEVGSLEVTIPALAPSPLRVELGPFVPAAGSVPDFSSLPTLDPQNPDLEAMATRAALAAEFVQQGTAALEFVHVKQEIGAEGGQMTLTSPNGAVFTLEVPAGAVEQKTAFYLMPIEHVGQLPFASGPLAAVQLHPPVPFHLPLSLTVTLPEGTPIKGGALAAGFTVSSFNRELSLAPVYPAGENRYRMNVYWGDTFGISAATPQELQAQAARIPTDSVEQVAQQLAALLASSNTDAGAEGQQRVFAQVMAGLWAQSGDILTSRLPGANAHLAAPRPQSSGARLVESISHWERVWSEQQHNELYDPDNPLYEPLNPDSRAKLIRDMAQAIRDFLKEHDGCRTKQDLYAESLLQILRNPDGDFQERIAKEYESKFGPADLEKSCTFMFHIVQSRIVTTATLPDGDLVKTVVVHTSPFELELVTRGKGFALRGAGAVTYEEYELDFTFCPPPLKLSHFPPSTIWITDLTPVFGPDDRLVDFVLQGTLPDPVLGDPNQGSVTVNHENGACKVEEFSQTGEPPDWFGITFPSLHSPYMHEDHWVIVGEDSYVATDTIVNRVESIGTETTTIVLTVTKR